jgi:hypothetical protein
MESNVPNVFTGQNSAPAGTALTASAQTDQSRAVAEVQAAMMIARMNPRNPIDSMDRILNACTRPTLANAAVYQYSKGGTDVSGPSIRLAEVLAQQWGNIKTSVRELDQANGSSTVQTIAWDLETGYQSEKVFQVPHLRYSKGGSKKLEDPRDIYEHVANQGSRRLRACILAVIPGDVTEAAVNQCDMTMRTKADTSPEAMAKMVESFAVFGVTAAQIEKRIQRHLDAIQPAQVVSLKKIYASLRDGMSTSVDWFDAIDGSEVATQKSDVETYPQDQFLKALPGWLKAIVGNKRTADQIIATAQSKHPLTEEQKAAIRSAPLTPAANATPAAGTPAAGSAASVGAIAVSFEAVQAKLLKAEDADLLDVAADLIGEVADPAQRAELTAIYNERRTALTT